MILTTRRTFLRGLFATPAIIAIDRLMPVRALLGDGVMLTSMADPIPSRLLWPGLRSWWRMYASGDGGMEFVEMELTRMEGGLRIGKPSAQMPVRTLRTPVDLRERLA